MQSTFPIRWATRLLAICSLIGVIPLFPFSTAHAASGPIRVLYFDPMGIEQTTLGPLHDAMRELGREAIWLDYRVGTMPTDEDLARYDALVVRQNADNNPRIGEFIHLAFVDAHGLGFATEVTKPENIRQMVIPPLSAQRKADWEKFLAQREPEKREASPTVANYEKRPEPVTFQHPFSVKGSKERTQVAADMHLELFASEPQIGKPIAFAWDERGRLWVAETRDYPHDVKPDGMGNDRIVICEDTDGDGRADKFTVFADHLNIPTALVFANGGVIVSQSPRFLFLKDSNGDGKADIREEIITGWGIRDTHAQANNLHYGLDNWLYGCVGYSGFEGTVRGAAMKFAQGTYRFKADGSALQFLHQFSNNSWGHSANDAGDQFGGTANNAPIFFGGIPASVVPKGVRVMTAKRINVQDKAHPITPNFRQVDVMGGYTAAAGSAFISSANLPPRMQGKAMVCEPTMKLIALMDAQPDGAGYVAKDGYNLVASSDEWMSPVFAEVGPDGAVWFADWQNFIIQHNPTPSLERGGFKGTTGVGGAHENPLRDHVRGRIYRVVWDNAKKPAVTTLKDATTPQLVAALGSDTQVWRLTAQRLLVEGKRIDAAPALKQAVTNAAPVNAIHALWTLHGLGQLDDATHVAALKSRDAAVRRNAVRALGSDEHAQKLFFSSGVMSDANLNTKLAAFVKLAEFPTTKDIQTLVASIAKNPANRADEWLNDAARMLAKKHKTELFKEGPNLLPNPGFEIVGKNGLPEGWARRDYGKRDGNAGADWKIVKGDGQFHGGKLAVRCISRDDADTSLHTDVTLKTNTQYRLSAWIKVHALKGKASLNDHIGRAETDRVSAKESDWVEVDTVFNSGNRATASINLLHVAKGDSYYDDVKLCEVVAVDDAVKLTAGDVKRGENIVFKHAAACILCHTIKGQGSTVGPVLDGIATRGTKEYIRESLLEPNKALAKGFENLGISPMPPMGDIFGPQELEDIQAYLQTLK